MGQREVFYLTDGMKWKVTDSLNTPWMEIGLVDAVWIDHRGERARMVIISQLLLPLLCCEVSGEWGLRTRDGF